METMFIFSDDGTNVSLFTQTNTYNRLTHRLEPLSVSPLRRTMGEVVGIRARDGTIHIFYRFSIFDPRFDIFTILFKTTPPITQHFY